MLLVAPLMAVFSLVLFLTTGKVIHAVPSAGYRPSHDPAEQTTHRPVFNLYRFQTLDRRGRRTAFGKWLEKSDFNRLPELWNLLKGDLRMVGVKPITPGEASELSEAWQQRRNEYYPGFHRLVVYRDGCGE